MAINEKYSFKNFTGQIFTGIDPSEFSNSEIVGSCFAQEIPYDSTTSHGNSANHRNPRINVFPNGVNNLIFRNCNLDNCVVVGNPVNVINCSTRGIRVMNDRKDWELDNISHGPQTRFAGSVCSGISSHRYTCSGGSSLRSEKRCITCSTLTIAISALK